jgi:hypothetical protein
MHTAYLWGRIALWVVALAVAVLSLTVFNLLTPTPTAVYR